MAYSEWMTSVQSESGADTAKERIENDIVQDVAMFDELGITGADVEQVIRLGKKQSGSYGTAKPRPLPVKIMFNSEENIIEVIRRQKGWSLGGSVHSSTKI